MDEFGSLEWAKSTETLEDILQNPRVKLPQLIRLASPLEFLDSKISLQQAQVLTVLAKQNISYVNAIDSHGKDVSIPLACPHTVKPVSPKKDCFFETVEDIIKCDPLPKFVEVTKIGKLDSHLKIVVGDVFKVVFVEKSEYAIDHIHFRNSVGTLIKVSVNDAISFQHATGYSTSILLSTLLNRRHLDFPLYVQFTKQEKIPKAYLDFGMLTLPNSNVTSMDVIIASASVSSTEYVVVYPLRLGIKFEVNNKLKLANDKGYRELCSRYSCISVEEADCYLTEMIGFKQNEHKFMMKYKKLKKDVQRSVSFVKREANATSSQAKAAKECPKTVSKTDDKHCDKNSKTVSKPDEKNCDKNSKIDSKSDEKKCDKNSKTDSKSDDKHSQDDTKSKKKNKKCDEKEKIKCEKEKLKESKKMEKEKSKKKSMEEDKAKYIKNENIYVHHPPSLLSKVKSMKLKKSKSNSKDELDLIKDEKPAIENPYSQIDYEFLDKIQDEIAKSPSLPLKLEPPPPLPGNHPCMNGGYATAADSRKGFYFDKGSYSAIEISTWGIKEVGDCLSTILLTKYKETFEDNLVDGKLLLDLDENVLIELGLNIFEARKLRKFVLGWRPGNTRPTSVYPPLKGFTSDEPTDWDVDDTALHMLKIDPGMAGFCRTHCVDGELLKDICVDSKIMEFIFPGNKLKVVKIKNYVIDKWRPKESNEQSSYEASSSQLGHQSSTKALSSDVPLVVRMKQQFEEKSKYSGVGVRESVEF